MVTTTTLSLEPLLWDLIQDTAWDGYEEVPGWIIDGYDTMFVEVDQHLADAGTAAADVMIVPTGLGSLLQAALRHYRSTDRGQQTAVVSVESTVAACVQHSVVAGEAVSVPTQETSMAGLNCGTPSSLAWPYIMAGLDGAATVTDAQAAEALEELAAHGVDAGPCGAASLAALHELTSQAAARAHLALDEHSVVVLLVTEGSSAS